MHEFVQAGASSIDVNLGQFFHLHTTSTTLFIIAGALLACGIAAKVISIVLGRQERAARPLVSAANATVRPAPVSRKQITAEQVATASAALSELLKEKAGNASKRMTIVAGTEKLTVKVSVANKYEWTRQKVQGKQFSELSALVPSKLNEVPVELVFEEPN